MINWERHPKIRRCAEIIASGGVVAYPTEAVWGLGCDPQNEASVRLLLHYKNRSPKQGLILVAANTRQFQPLFEHLSEDQRRRVMETWPGSVTWLLPNYRQWAPPWITGEHDSVAIRVTAHPVARALCQQLGRPLVSTSANPHGRRPAKNRIDVQRYFGERLDYVAPGYIGGHTNVSEIRDLNSGNIVRPA